MRVDAVFLSIAATWLAAKFLVLVAAANTAPLVAKKLVGDRLDLPLDFGLHFLDGRRLLGPSKTWRGVFSALVVCTALAPMMGVSWRVGAGLAAGAMLGDVLSSFAKRRLGIAPSGKAPVLDQIPEVLVPLLIAHSVQPISMLLVAADVALFLVLEPPLARLWHRWGLRDQPY